MFHFFDKDDIRLLCHRQVHPAEGFELSDIEDEGPVGTPHFENSYH